MMYLIVVVVWLALLALVTLGWSLIHLQFGRWASAWSLERSYDDSSFLQEIRVVIPARNEERVIASCLQALVDTPNSDVMEVVVIDDGSEDNTGDIARRFQNDLPGLKVLRGHPRPSAWSGKAWACHQGAAGCDRAWICFVDADVSLDPQTLSSTLAVARREQLDLLSLFGSWTLLSFWERLLIPAIGWFIRGAVQIDEVNHGQAAFANGQFLLFNTESYVAMGGHESVRDTVLDDVGLARAMQAWGGRLGLRYAPWSFSVRLYTSFGEIYRGYQKNLFEGMERRMGLAIVAAGFVFTWSVGPFISCLVAGLLNQPWIVLWSAVLALSVVLFRFRVERRDERSGAIKVALLHPLAAGLLSWIIVHSMLSRTVSWKGRTFERGKSSTGT